LKFQKIRGDIALHNSKSQILHTVAYAMHRNIIFSNFVQINCVNSLFVSIQRKVLRHVNHRIVLSSLSHGCTKTATGTP